MGQREALQALTSNNNLRRGLPRLAFSGKEPSIRTRKFVSTSKTPKISNRPIIPHKSPTISGVRLFVTTPRPPRHQRPPLYSGSKIRAKSTHNRKASMPQKAFREHSSAKKRPTNDRKLIHWAEASSNEDMDICSDGDVSLDSESSSPKASRPQATVAHYQPTGADIGQAKTANRIYSRVEPFSSFVPNLPQAGRRTYHPNSYTKEFPTPPSSADENIINDKHWVSKLKKNALKSARDQAVDESILLTKWLQGPASQRSLDDDSARDTRMQDSVDYSDLTDSTRVGMPSFPPRDDLLNDFIEEWSLPDEETNDVILFSLQGKQYVHDPLPPGWVMRVSKTRQRPFYIHPDHGITWHCPIILKPKSEALVLRRSSLQKLKQDVNCQQAATPRNAVSPIPHSFSLEGSMSELIHHYNDPQVMDGYEGSVSSTSTIDSDLTSTIVSSCTATLDGDAVFSGHRDKNDWVTPLRLEISTPLQGSQRLGAATKQSSIRKLSPIEETAKATPAPSSSQLHPQYNTTNYSNNDRNKWDPSKDQISTKRNGALGMSSAELVHPAPRGERSTPRVSFEPMEVTRHEESIHDANNDSGQKPSGGDNAPSPKSPVRLRHVNHASTPISDTDDTSDGRRIVRREETVVVESACHSLAFRPRYTPKTTPLQVASTLRHTAMKGKGFQLISMSETRMLGEIRPRLPSTPWQQQEESPFTMSNDENGQRLSKLDALHNGKVMNGDSCETPDDTLTTPGSATSSHNAPVINLSSGKVDKISQCRQNNSSRPRTSSSLTPVSQNVTTESTDPNDASSPNHYCTPSQSQGESHTDSPVMWSHRSTLSSRHDKLSSPSASTIKSPLSINIQESSPEMSLEVPVDDDPESEELTADQNIKTKCRPFGWRVLHPPHPICSLQRLDELLKEQRERRRKVPHTPRNRTQRTKSSKQNVRHLRQKQQAKAKLVF